MLGTTAEGDQALPPIKLPLSREDQGIPVVCEGHSTVTVGAKREQIMSTPTHCGERNVVPGNGTETEGVDIKNMSQHLSSHPTWQERKEQTTLTGAVGLGSPVVN